VITPFAAAAALALAVDTVVQLERCERATGRPWVRDADRERIKAARVCWLAVRA